MLQGQAALASVCARSLHNWCTQHPSRLREAVTRVAREQGRIVRMGQGKIEKASNLPRREPDRAAVASRRVRPPAYTSREALIVRMRVARFDDLF